MTKCEEHPRWFEKWCNNCIAELKEVIKGK